MFRELRDSPGSSDDLDDGNDPDSVPDIPRVVDFPGEPEPAVFGHPAMGGDALFHDAEIDEESELEEEPGHDDDEEGPGGDVMPDEGPSHGDAHEDNGGVIVALEHAEMGGHGHEEQHGHEEPHAHEEQHGHEEPLGHEEQHGPEALHGHEESHGHEAENGQEADIDDGHERLFEEVLDSEPKKDLSSMFNAAADDKHKVIEILEDDGDDDVVKALKAEMVHLSKRLEELKANQRAF